MAYRHQEEYGAETAFPQEGAWLRSDMPDELARSIAEEFGEADRQGLAGAAAAAATDEVGEAYRSPFVRHAAESAARMALGLKPLPEEGEQ